VSVSRSKWLVADCSSRRPVFSHRGVRVVFMVEQSKNKTDLFKSIPLLLASMKPPILDTSLFIKNRSNKI
jgi:hypothetical protein